MIDRNDPRLTAYALGEMNAAERADFEKALASDPSARAEVEAIRALGGQLRAELAKAPAPALTEAQRASVAKAARRRIPLAILLMPVAACLLAAVAIFWPGPTLRANFSARIDRTRVAEAEQKVRHERNERLEEGAPKRPYDDSFFGSSANPQNAPPGTVPDPSIVDDAPAPAPSLQGRGDTGSPPPPSDPGDPRTTLAPPKPVEAPEEALEVLPTTPAGPQVGTAVTTSGPMPKAKENELIRKRAFANSSLTDEPRFQKDPSDREGYDRIRENPFIRVAEEDSSTFSIDVDTASYANVRRFLMQQNRLPPPDAVRLEEMINYFSYSYEPPVAGSPDPFRIHVEVASCPWDATHRLARVAIKGKVIDSRERPASNLVFLVDVSGSMDEPAKLPLVQAALRLLAGNLGEKDRVAIAVYAGAAGLVLPSTGDKQQVIDAIDRLKAGGSTAGAAGIQLAYEIAAQNFIKGGVNRVILCTDGDFNVGVTDDGSLTRLIEEKAKSGVFLSVLGFGTGNYQDAKMQQLADKGNGNHAYIDSILEAKKVLGEEMSGTLVTIAKDVKIQLFFNPKKVAGFRLIGYENRLLAKQDFNDDKKDAGEIGAGHSVTALYELVPAGSEVPGAKVDENPFVAKAGGPRVPEATVDSDALFQLRLRYKQPDGDESKLLEQMVRDGGDTFDAASRDFRWASAVASFGMALRGTGTMGLDAVAEIAKSALGDDKGGYRGEFLKLVETAKLLKR